MPEALTDGAVLLDVAYEALDLRGAQLQSVDAAPPDAAHADWLTLAARVGADRVFFVDDDPVVVFSALSGDADDREILDVYRRTWCLARPRCLFLAVGDELRVYALSQLPERHDLHRLRALEVVERASDVADQLAAFRRERLETGAAFDGAAFEQPKRRADARLLQDVRFAEAALMDAGLSRRGAHQLIERAVLVRYLEDRKVLTAEYFDKLARRKREWKGTLDDFEEPIVGASSRFVTCLTNRELTVALFDHLAEDFNGDLFVDRDGELAELSARQLAVLHDLLSGATVDGQGQLFLWAYDFSVVPTSLISSMYELFYRREAEQKTSTYYTPQSLVEFVLSSVLTTDVLEREPVVCDPACGSGVFLVEAFRRIARHETTRRGRRLSSRQLQRLLLERVRGVDLDEAAVRLAAFSLYLAFLDMQTPPDILRAGALPRLISAEHDDHRPLRVGDAFADGVLPDRAFDVVIANPPWTEPKAGAAMREAREWADERGLPYGDKNPSQLFVWRALELLTENGRAALLVGAGALLNTRDNSKDFRRTFLQRATLEHVVALWPIRGDFFAGARAPFAYLRYRRNDDDSHEERVAIFDTARRGGPRDASLTFVPVRRRLVRTAQLADHDFLWKTMTQGGRRDADLVLRLHREQVKLGSLIDEDRPPRYGWQRAHRPGVGVEPDDTLRAMRSVKKLEAWGPIVEEWEVPLPGRVTRVPHSAVFDGQRLIVDMGVTGDERLHARLIDGPLAFDHNIWALPLQHRPAWEAEVALGVLLSSTGRYFLAMTAGLWGVWRDQMRKGQLIELPLRLPSATDSRVSRIRHAVSRLATSGEPSATLFEPVTVDAHAVLRTLDDAVMDLFELADFERDLVRDHWLERAAQRDLLPGLGAQPARGRREVIRRYAETFRAAWRPLLGDGLDLSFEVHPAPAIPVLAAVFTLHRAGDPPASDVDASWEGTLRKLETRLSDPASSLRMFATVRAVTDSDIILVKRDRPELWTASAAREDAEAVSVQIAAQNGA